MEKAREFQKNIYFCLIDYAKAFDYVDHNKLENSSVIDIQYLALMIISLRNIETWKGTRVAQLVLK